MLDDVCALVGIRKPGALGWDGRLTRDDDFAELVPREERHVRGNASQLRNTTTEACVERMCFGVTKRK